MRCLHIFVEGPDDERFFERTRGLFEMDIKYGSVKIIKYAQKPAKKINDYIRAIRKQDPEGYIFVADIDDSTCISRKKAKLLRDMNSLENGKVYIVRKEIEGWYLAGITPRDAAKLGISKLPNETNTLDKEKFYQYRPKSTPNNTLFKLRLLQVFNPNLARRKNFSFDYFFRKVIL